MYDNMDKKILKKLQDTELEILCDIDRVCRENNIKYFLMFGTLLGAVRHKGFIPWDDDIDIGMEREDYEKFLKIAPKKLKSKFSIDNININKNYYLPYLKVKNNNTIFLEKNAVNYNGNNGMWVDIFPFDNYKTNKKGFLFKLKFKFISFFHGIMIYRTLNLYFGKPSIFIFLGSKFLTNKMCLWFIEILSKRSNKGNYILYYDHIGIKNTIVYNRNDIFPLKEIEFCGRKFYSPNNSNKILSLKYGDDYMVLPPVSERVTHNPLKIVFEDSNVIDFDK
jgi:lipopolysaccharide cholinephosphotransferase